MKIGLVDTPVKRSYDATRRRVAAERSRQEILVAARDLFREGGYAATTVRAVADRAGVSLDTVYAKVGRKAELLLAVHDMELAEASAPVPAEHEAGTAAEKIRLYAEAMGRLLPRSVPLMVALREAGAEDPACAAQYEAVTERRAANMRLFAADLRATGELRADFDDDRVADLVWSLNSPEWFQLLTSRGLSGPAYGELLADVLTRTLLS
jgi:AcrR family transcriptional regulator